MDIAPYARRRDLFCEVLTQAGYEFLKPQGAFYLFPKAPGGDDLGPVARLKEENILAVPGRGFGRAGYFRLAFCVPERSLRPRPRGSPGPGKRWWGNGFGARRRRTPTSPAFP